MVADGVAKDWLKATEDACITPRFADCGIVDSIAGVLSDARGFGMLFVAIVGDVVSVRAVWIPSTR